MKEKEIAPGVLAQYSFSVCAISRIRGGYLLATEDGNYFLKESKRTKERIEFENLIHNRLQERGNVLSDKVMQNEEGEYVTCDNYGNFFVVKNWPGGTTCIPNQRSEVIRAMESMAIFHKDVNGIYTENLLGRKIDINDEYVKYNKELKRARNYIRKKKRKTDFEIEVLKCFEMYYEKCKEDLERIEDKKFDKYKNKVKENMEICHSDFSYHNVLWNQEKNMPVIINMESACYGMNIFDIYKFIRKVLEKNNWDIVLGLDMLEAYDKIKTISSDERELISIMMSYPEKFRKLVNHYYNNNKAWISDKNIEKLYLIREQSRSREKFAKYL